MGAKTDRDGRCAMCNKDGGVRFRTPSGSVCSYKCRREEAGETSKAREAGETPRDTEHGPGVTGSDKCYQAHHQGDGKVTE